MRARPRHHNDSRPSAGARTHTLGRAHTHTHTLLCCCRLRRALASVTPPVPLKEISLCSSDTDNTPPPRADTHAHAHTHTRTCWTNHSVHFSFPFFLFFSFNLQLLKSDCSLSDQRLFLSLSLGRPLFIPVYQRQKQHPYTIRGQLRLLSCKHSGRKALTGTNTSIMQCLFQNPSTDLRKWHIEAAVVN